MLSKKLGQICKLRQGFQVPVDRQITECKEGYVRFIRIVDYTQKTDDIRYVLDDEKFYYVKPDDVVMVRYGAAGEVGHGISGVIANNMFLIDPVMDINKDYLFYYLSQAKVKNKLLSASSSTTMPALNFKIVNDLDIPIWSRESQDDIVKHLDKIKGIISKRREELTKLDELVKARFVEMFGYPFDNSKWNVKELKELSESMLDGSNVNTDHYESEGEVLFLRIQNVWRNEFRLDDSVYISQDINKEKYYDTSLKKGDLLITKIGRYYTKDSSLGRVSIYRGKDDCANYSNNIMRARLNDSMNSEFVNALLNLDEYQSFIKRTSKGGTDKRALSKGLIGSYPIIMPPKELQNEYADFVKQVDKSKVVVQKALDEAQLLFDSLMQAYFG